MAYIHWKATHKATYTLGKKFNENNTQACFVDSSTYQYILYSYFNERL